MLEIIIFCLLCAIVREKTTQTKLKTKTMYSFSLPLLLTRPRNGYEIIWVLVGIALLLLIYLIYLYLKRVNATPVKVVETVYHEKEVISVVKEESKTLILPSQIERTIVEDTPKKSIPKTILNYSFYSRIHLASKEALERYEAIRAKLLSYMDVSVNETWKYERFVYRGKSIVKIKLQGKTMRLFFALDPREIIDEKYHIKDVHRTKTHENTPSLLIVRGPRGVKHGIELIEQYMEKHHVQPIEDYIYQPLKFKKMSKLQLLKNGWIKTNDATFIERLEEEERLKEQNQ